MKKVGKVGLEWQKSRSKWLKENPPNHEGYYVCYLCGIWVLASEITLDHVLPRSKRPDLRTDFSNLEPCCYSCNKKKGSKVYGT